MNMLSTLEFNNKLQQLEPYSQKKVASEILKLRNYSTSNHRKIRNINYLENNIYVLKAGQYRIFYSIEEKTTSVVLLDMIDRNENNTKTASNPSTFNNISINNKFPFTLIKNRPLRSKKRMLEAKSSLTTYSKPTSLVRVKDLYMKYNKSDDFTLKDINFSLSIEEFVFFVGPRGSGRSTMIKLISGQEFPYSGTLKLFQRKVPVLQKQTYCARLIYKFKNKNLLSGLHANTGLVTPQYKLHENLTVYDNVAKAMFAWGVNRNEAKRRVPYLLRSMGIQNKENTLVGGIPIVEKQRVKLACAIVTRPAIIVIDDPIYNTEPLLAHDIIDLLVNQLKFKMVIFACEDEQIAGYLQSKNISMTIRTIRFEDGKIVTDNEYNYTYKHKGGA